MLDPETLKMPPQARRAVVDDLVSHLVTALLQRDVAQASVAEILSAVGTVYLRLGLVALAMEPEHRAEHMRAILDGLDQIRLYLQTSVGPRH